MGLIRSKDRMEMLYPRSKVVTTAKAFGLQAIDLVRSFVPPSVKLKDILTTRCGVTGLREL